MYSENKCSMFQILVFFLFCKDILLFIMIFEGEIVEFNEVNFGVIKEIQLCNLYEIVDKFLFEVGGVKVIVYLRNVFEILIVFQLSILDNDFFG